MKNKAFTLIELMIVVAIIALISAIAIPSLLKARLQSNETAAIGNLRTIVTAQTSYHRDNNQYANNYATLATTEHLPDDAIADAYSTATAMSTTPKGGYYFASNTFYNGQSYMTLGSPSMYNSSGRYSYFVNDEGSVYQVDRAATAAANIGEYDDNNDWDANRAGWESAK